MEGVLVFLLVAVMWRLLRTRCKKSSANATTAPRRNQIVGAECSGSLSRWVCRIRVLLLRNGFQNRFSVHPQVKITCLLLSVAVHPQQTEALHRHRRLHRRLLTERNAPQE